MEKNGHRYVIQYFHLKGLSRTHIKAKLDSALGKSAPSFTTVEHWVAELKRGRTSCQDVGISKSVVHRILTKKFGHENAVRNVAATFPFNK